MGWRPVRLRHRIDAHVLRRGRPDRVAPCGQCDRLDLPRRRGVDRPGGARRLVRRPLARPGRVPSPGGDRCLVREPLVDPVHPRSLHLPPAAVPRRSPAVAPLEMGRVVRRRRDRGPLRHGRALARSVRGLPTAREPVRDRERAARSAHGTCVPHDPSPSECTTDRLCSTRAEWRTAGIGTVPRPARDFGSLRPSSPRGGWRSPCVRVHGYAAPRSCARARPSDRGSRP